MVKLSAVFINIQMSCDFSSDAHLFRSESNKSFLWRSLNYLIFKDNLLNFFFKLRNLKSEARELRDKSQLLIFGPTIFILQQRANTMSMR